MFPFRWLRSLVRKNTSPIPKDSAVLWRERLSKIYLFLAFNCLGLIIYTTYKQDIDVTDKKMQNPIVRYSALLHGNVSYKKISGFKLEEDFEVDMSKFKESDQ